MLFKLHLVPEPSNQLKLDTESQHVKYLESYLLAGMAVGGRVSLQTVGSPTARFEKHSSIS